MNTEKMIQTSRKLDTFFKVLRKIIVIGMSVAILIMAAITVIYFIDPSSVIGEDFHMIDIGTLTIELAPQHAPDNSTILIYSWSLMTLGTFCAAIIYYALGLLRKILQPMTQGQPFAPSVGDDIKKMSFVCLALGIVQNIANVLDTTNAIRAYQLADLSNSEQIVSITANYTIDITFLIFFLSWNSLQYTSYLL
jgi:hypothetical protein